MKKKLVYTFIAAFTLISLQNISHAHQPIIEAPKEIITETNENSILDTAVEIQDPTYASQAIYGRLNTPSEIDIYKFTVSKTEEIPIEVLVPARRSNKDFAPSYAFIQQGDEKLSAGSQQQEEKLATYSQQRAANSSQQEAESPQLTALMDLPPGYSVNSFDAPRTNRETFYEPFSAEKLYKGNEQRFKVEQGKAYYIAVYEPKGYTGDYSLGVGVVENFEDANFVELISNVVKIKLGLVGGLKINNYHFLGVFLMIAGLIIGLGAVTVIDMHGFLGQKSPYWTESTIRAHKVTKPLIWLGTLLLGMGMLITYKDTGLSGTGLFQVVLYIIMILNGIFLSFYVSPFLLKREKEGRVNELLPRSLQSKIKISFVISFISWWSFVLLFVWYLLYLS